MRVLFVLCLVSRVARTEPYNASDVIDVDYDGILASEGTPTLAPKSVTRQGVVASSDDVLFQTDCSEPLNKDVSCSVHIVDCSDPIFEQVPSGSEPPKAHDVRIAPTTKVMGSNRIDKRKHRLQVDVSWQIPSDASSRLKAFKLLISDSDGKSTCFVFNVTHHHDGDENVSPRYRFSSNTLFEFGDTYTVTIVSLPVSSSRIPKVTATSTMPDDPDEATKVVRTHEEICSGKSNSQASKWAASFRKIFLFSAIQMIQIEFLAAPPHYCFEEYEVRLLDSSGIVMLQSAIVSKEDLKTEIINGRPVQFGEYNFTDIELDTDLIPSVIPIETARDGRCLCETENGCSCLAADWKPVKLTKVEKPPSSTNLTIESDKKAKQGEPTENLSYWHTMAFTGITCIAVIFGLILCFGVRCYRRVHKTKKTANVNLLNENYNFPTSGSIPLIMKQNVSVLIIYSHDSSQHDASVLALAELLRDVYNLNVHLDVWDEEDIETNKAEYLNSSISRADKVILINSIGAYHRTVARHNKEPALERIVSGRNDAVFGNQIDLALQHPSVISCRFSYTDPKFIMFPVSRLLQYTVPESLNTLTTAVAGQTARGEQLAGFNSIYARLQSAISRKAHYMSIEPDWFEKTHHRAIMEPADCAPEPVPLPSSLMFKTRDTVSVEVEEEEEDVGPAESSVGSTADDEDRTARMEELERLIVNKDHDDSGNLDSAYVSGSDFSTDLHTEVLDKPRLNSNEDCHAVGKRKSDVTVDSAFHDDVIGVH